MSITTNEAADLIRSRFPIGATFTANDVPEIRGDGHSQGAVWQHLKRRGLIKKTGHYITSLNPRSRGDVLAIWRRAA